MEPKSAPYGTWDSPITADFLTQSGKSIEDIIVDPIRSTVYHSEGRPAEGGRSVIVNTHTKRPVFNSTWNARTSVHEYGGCAFIAYDGVVYFSHFGDFRVYRVDGSGDGEPEPVTPGSDRLHRFANFAVCPKNPGVLVSVLEDHTVDTPQTVVNTLCVINTTTKTVEPLVSGSDFYASPVFSFNGHKLAWTEWNHPYMPWQRASIYIADVTLESGLAALSLTNIRCVASSDSAYSVGYPAWIDNDTLFFLSEKDVGYRNPWKYSLLFDEAQPILREPIFADFANCNMGLVRSQFTLLEALPGKGLFKVYHEGRGALYLVDLAGELPPLEIATPFIEMNSIHEIPSSPAQVVFAGQSTDSTGGIVFCTLLSSSPFSIVPSFEIDKSHVSPDEPVIDSSFIARPQPIALTIDDEPLYVAYYAPTNPEYTGSSIPAERPPCIISAHGGPHTMASQTLSWSIQFWTSRGWAWVDVNYGGSTNFGRKYLDRLDGQWGVVDVQDCIDAAQALSRAPYSLIDPARLCIRGGSAGGYTTLAVATIASDVSVFAAGTSLCGVANLVPFAMTTHKFESRYLDSLMGGTLEEIRGVYEARSPSNHVDRVVIPLLFLQGADDKVVPKEQSEELVAKIQSRGGKAKYLLFEGEGHGWRKAETIKAAQEAELSWYEEVLGLRTSQVLKEN